MKNPKTIFKLTVIKYWDEKPKYPDFEVHKHTISYFSSLIKAEQAILKYIKDKYGKIFGFKINEYVLDEYSYWETPKSWRTYLSDGSLWDESIEPSMWYENGKPYKEYFAGRPAEKIRFKVGDLVEVLNDDDTVTLEIVEKFPWTTEFVQQFHERCRKDGLDTPVRINHTYDFYDTIDKNGEDSHSRAIDVFPARLKVSSKLRDKLNFAYANAEK